MKNLKEKKHLKKVLIFAVVLILFLFATNPAIIPFTSGKFKSSVSGVWQSLFGDVGGIVSMFSVNWATFFKLVAMILFMIILGNLLSWIVSLFKPKSGRGKSAKSLIANTISYLVTIIGIIWGLSIIGVNTTAIFAGVGVLALVLSFGAESLIEDVITGIFLVFDKQFNVGDIIEIDGFRGTVEQIGVRSTYIKDAGGNVQILNNSSIKKVLNRSIAQSMASCEVSVAYEADIEKTEKVLAEVLPAIQKKYPEIFPEAPRYLGIQDLGDSAVVLKIVAPVEEKNIYSAPRYMRREIKIAFDKAGIEIPFPQVVVHNAKD